MLEEFQDLDEIRRIIVFETGASVEKMAEQIKYSRPHLALILTKGGSEDVVSEVRGKLIAAYKDKIIQFVSRYSNFAGKIWEQGSFAQDTTVLMKTIADLSETNKNLSESNKTLTAAVAKKINSDASGQASSISRETKIVSRNPTGKIGLGRQEKNLSPTRKQKGNVKGSGN